MRGSLSASSILHTSAPAWGLVMCSNPFGTHYLAAIVGELGHQAGSAWWGSMLSLPAGSERVAGAGGSLGAF